MATKNTQKIGWIDGAHIRRNDGTKIGYYKDGFIYNEAAHKIAYIHENELVLENGSAPISLEHVNEHIVGTHPPIVKCAVLVLLEE